MCRSNTALEFRLYEDDCESVCETRPGIVSKGAFPYSIQEQFVAGSDWVWNQESGY